MRALAVLAVLALAGCTWGIVNGSSDAVTIAHYGQSVDGAIADAERWCGRFGRPARLVSTRSQDATLFYYNSDFRCVP